MRNTKGRDDYQPVLCNDGHADMFTLSRRTVLLSREVSKELGKSDEKTTGTFYRIMGLSPKTKIWPYALEDPHT
jgi:hypothetical protein